MITNKIVKLKKYLFLISVLFLTVSLTHLIYTFLYSDSELVPIKGGTVSEGLIGSFPSLNPLKPLSGNNKYVIELLYRSMLKYDLNENKIVGDLANCDISNLLKVECYLKDNVYWSNGELITVEDIIGTYRLIQTTGVNKIISSSLEGTEIEQNGNTIIFTNDKKDINFLNIFFQPILSTQTINSIGNETIFGNFPTHEQIYSGDFMISNISSDMTIGITKIFLEKNPFNDNGNIAKLIIKLFPNTNSLLQNKESINIFNDNDNIIGGSIPRLENNEYTLPQFVSLFINQEKIDNLNMRNFILNKINTDNLIKILGEDNYKKVNNPYLSDTELKKDITNKNFEQVIGTLGYIKKSKIIENYLPNSTLVYSNEAIIVENKEVNENSLTEEKEEIEEEKIKIPRDLSIDDYQEDSKYITLPTFVDKYNFITRDDILLEGNAGKGVEEVWINEYKLSNFTSGGSKFYYRLDETYSSINEGENNYKIYFVENGKKILKEEINFLFYKNKTTLDSETLKFIEKLYIAENTKEEIEEQKEVIVEKIEIDKTKLEQLSNLDEKYYYNEDLDRYTLDLYYISAERELEETAFFIKNSLQEIGIDVELFPISISDLSSILGEKDRYDMLLTGINLGYFDYNIFPYFHSSQAKNGYNFSNIKKTSLDILLEDLKSGIRTPEETLKIQEKVLGVLQNEQIIKTLYTPKINLLVDKNIKDVYIPESITNKSDRKELYKSIYVKEEKIINFNDKGIIDFFSFLFKKLND